MALTTQAQFSLWHLMVLVTAACFLVGIGTVLGAALSVLAMALGLMVLPPVGPLVARIGRQRESVPLQQLGNALQWLWLALFLGFGATLLALLARGEM
jgi:hypothetical protein